MLWKTKLALEYLEYQQRIIWKVEKETKEMVEAVNVETMQSNNGSIVEISIILIIYFLIYRIYSSVKINICKVIIFSIVRKKYY